MKDLNDRVVQPTAEEYTVYTKNGAGQQQGMPETSKKPLANFRTIEYLQRGVDAAKLPPLLADEFKQKLASDTGMTRILKKYGQMTENGYVFATNPDQVKMMGAVDYEQQIITQAFVVGMPLLKGKIKEDEIRDLGQHIYRAIGGQIVKPFRSIYMYAK